MKKEILIKQIASEFNVDEIEVSEYFDSIFETLATAFIKNRNVNISEFGKFKVNSKTSEDGEKKKTVSFSPVKKFADEINYNFSDLSPVQIRLIDTTGNGVQIEDVYDEDEIEEVILIDFEECTTTEEKQEEVLIPEVTEQEISTEETEKQEEEILIPEETAKEIILEKSEEKKEEIIPQKVEVKEERTSFDDERLRIFGLLQEIKIPEIKFEQFEEKIIPKEIESADLKAFSEATAFIIEEKRDEITEEPVLEEPEEQIQEEITEEPVAREQDVFIADDAEDVKEEEKEEEQKKSDIEELDEAIDELKALLDKEEQLQAGGEKDEEKEIPKEEEKIPEELINPLEEPEQIIREDIEIKEEKKEEAQDNKKTAESEPQKSSLELEAELLKMLDERKKILEEINRLETEKTDDIMDISGPKANGDELPKLYDDTITDRMKQNVFVEEEGKILEELLSLITQQGTDKPAEEDKKEIEKEIIPEKPEEKEKIEKIDFEEKQEKTKENTEDIDKLFGSIYGGTEEKTEPPVQPEDERHFKNSELNVFDKLLDEPVKQEKEQEATLEKTIEPYKEETTISDLEKMFRSFKTEITEPEKKEENIAEEKLPEETVQKTETIKTYDDIFNLIEPNGKKKEEKPIETIPPPEKEPEPPKKSGQNLKIGIIVGALVLVIIIIVIWYNKAVKQPVENQSQIPITAPVDSGKTKGADSVIYADTNKVSEKSNDGETVYDKDDMKILETEKGYYIEFGEFENQFILAKKIKELKDKNITPGYEEVKEDGRQYYKMKIGPYQSLKEAKSIMSKL